MDGTGWDGKTLGLVAVGIVAIVMLWDSFPFAGLLILAAVLLVVSRGHAAGNIQYPS